MRKGLTLIHCIQCKDQTYYWKRNQQIALLVAQWMGVLRSVQLWLDWGVLAIGLCRAICCLSWVHRTTWIDKMRWKVWRLLHPFSVWLICKVLHIGLGGSECCTVPKVCEVLLVCWLGERNLPENVLARRFPKQKHRCVSSWSSVEGLVLRAKEIQSLVDQICLCALVYSGLLVWIAEGQ